MTVAVTPQYQAVQVKPTYSGSYGTPARTVAAAKPVTNYGYVGNTTNQPAYSTPQPTATTYTNVPAAANSAATSQSVNTGSGSSSEYFG